MEKGVWLVYVIFILGVAAIMYLHNKSKKEKLTKSQREKDKKYIAGFLFFICAILILVIVALCIDIVKGPFFLENYLLLVFLLVFTSLFLLGGIILIRPIKIGNGLDIILTIGFLSLGGAFLVNLIPEKQWLKAGLIILLMIYILFRKKLEKFYNPDLGNTHIKS